SSRPCVKFHRSGGSDFFSLGAGRLPEITEPAFLDGAIREFQSDLRRPAGLGLDHVFHHADGAGNPVDHGFAKITRPGLRYFGFAHDIESMLNRNHMSSRLHSASTRQGGEEPVFAKATPRQGVE